MFPVLLACMAPAVERINVRTGSYPIVSDAVDAVTLRSMAWDSKGSAQSRHTWRASCILTVAVDGLVWPLEP